MSVGHRLVMVFSILLAPALGWAAPTSTVYAGFECQDEVVGAVYGGPGAGGSFVAQGSAAYCPIRRHNTSNTNGLAGVKVTVQDMSATDYVQCTVFSTNLNRDITDTSTRVTTLAFVGVTTFDFGASLDTSVVDGPFFLYCRTINATGGIGKDYRVFSYKVTEY